MDGNPKKNDFTWQTTRVFAPAEDFSRSKNKLASMRKAGFNRRIPLTTT
jgi:hypothetical protein